MAKEENRIAWEYLQYLALFTRFSKWFSWVIFYLGPFLSGWILIALGICHPHVFLAAGILITYPIMFILSFYIFACKKFFWDFDYSNGEGEVLLMENQYMSFNEIYDMIQVELQE